MRSPNSCFLHGDYELECADAQQNRASGKAERRIEVLAWGTAENR